MLRSQRHEPGDKSQEPRCDTIRADDRRRRAVGDFPEPDWSDEGALKVWLEQRFPLGTEAGSPFLQYMIASCELNGPYTISGRGSEVGRLSEIEWNRFRKAQPQMALFKMWSEAPLYPDAEMAGVQQDHEDSNGLTYISPQHRTRDDLADVPLLHEDGNTDKTAHTHGRSTTETRNSKQAGGARKRTADLAGIETGDPSAAKRTRQADGKAKSPPTAHLPDPSARSSKNVKTPEHIFRPSARSTPSREVEALEHEPYKVTRQLGAREDQRSDRVTQPSSKLIEGQEEDEEAMMPGLETDIEEEGPGASGATARDERHVQETDAIPPVNQPGPSQKRDHQDIPVVAPPHGPLNRTDRRKNPKTRKTTTSTAFQQTRYTTKHLRAGVGQRRHAPPSM